MAKFTIWAKADAHPDFERVCEIDQLITTGTDQARDEMAGHIASRWMQDNGNGQVEFRNAAGAPLIRITRP